MNNNLRELIEVEVKVKLDGDLQRVGEIPQFQSDAIVRRSPPLQKTRQVVKAVLAALHPEQMQKLGINDGERILVKQGESSTVLEVHADSRVPLGCVRIPGALPETAGLGDLMGEITVERMAAEQPEHEVVA